MTAGQIVYVQDHPSRTRYMRQIQLIAGLITRSTDYYVTAEHWGRIIAELDAQYSDALMDPTKPAPWKPHPNEPFVFGMHDPKLRVINAGTDDEKVVWLLNEHPAAVAEFGVRRDRLRTG
jgi:hypothetical protein